MSTLDALECLGLCPANFEWFELNVSWLMWAHCWFGQADVFEVFAWGHRGEKMSLAFLVTSPHQSTHAV